MGEGKAKVHSKKLSQQIQKRIPYKEPSSIDTSTREDELPHKDPLTSSPDRECLSILTENFSSDGLLLLY